MKSCLAIFVLLAGMSARAQTVANTSNVLHPIMKDPNHRNGISSLDQDPQEKASLYQSPKPGQPAAPRALQPAQASPPAKASEIVARIDPSLAVSKLNVIGTVTGLKGRLYVTNVGSAVVTPSAQIAVCDRNGFKIAATTKAGEALAPNDSEKIEIFATNADAANLKLMKVSAFTEK